MKKIDAVEKIFFYFGSIIILAQLQFITAISIGISASVSIGAIGLIIWVAVGFFLLYKSRFWEKISLFTIIVFSLFSIWTLWLSTMPPYFRDDLIVHLEIPNYLLSHANWELPTFRGDSTRPNLLYLISTVFVSFGFDSLASFIPALFFLGSIALLGIWVCDSMPPLYGWIATTAFASLPIFFRLATTDYSDPAIIFLSLCGVILFFRYVRDNSLPHGILGAVSLASSSAIKYNGGLLLVCSLALLFLIELRRKDFISYTKVATASVVAVLIFCGPWWLKNGIKFEQKTNAVNAMAIDVPFKGPIEERVLLCKEPVAWALLVPVRVFFSGEEGSSCKFDGKLNPFYLVLAIASLLCIRRRETFFIGATSLLYISMASVLFSITARYILPVVPPLLYLCVILLKQMKTGEVKLLGKTVSQFVLPIGLLMVLYNASGLYHRASFFNGWGYLLGRESKKEFVSRYLPSQDALEFANKTLSSNDKIYFVFLGNQVYYSDIDYFYDPFYTGRTFMGIFQNSINAKEAKQKFLAMGVTHLLVHKKIAGRFFINNRLTAIANDFRSNQVKILFEDNLVILMKL